MLTAGGVVVLGEDEAHQPHLVGPPRLVGRGVQAQLTQNVLFNFLNSRNYPVFCNITCFEHISHNIQSH